MTIIDPAHSATYCNPLPLVDYQQGLACSQPGYSGPGYREMADPAAIRFQGRWYLFPSAGMLWHSDDMVHWQHRRIEPFAPGYAPAVVVAGDWLYLSFSWEASAIWRARHPFGPWEQLGTRSADADGNPTWLRDHLGRPVRWGDPCLLLGGDGELYCYCNLTRPTRPEDRHPWRLIPEEGVIFGVRLRRDDPTTFAAEPVPLLGFDPALRWERSGEANQSRRHPVLEGAWTSRIGSRYYLQYSVNRTECRNYALACAVGDTPLGPFVRQRHNPILIHAGGLINGCGHHSLVEGPDGTWWCFYTILMRIRHHYERRIAMDPAFIDAHGELHVRGPSETPQHAPGTIADPGQGNAVGWDPVSIHVPVTASGAAPGRDPAYAVDPSLRTWWQAPDAQAGHWLQLDLEEPFELRAARIIFADIGLDYRSGAGPRPYGYRLLGSMDGSSWTLLCDCTGNMADRHIAYEPLAPTPARHVRLEITRVPPGLTAAIQDLTIFARTQILPEGS